MDDATRRYLISPRIHSLRVPYAIDKTQVMEITSQLLDRNDLTGTLRDAFDAYVGACMEYNMQRVSPVVIPAPIACDSILLPPKKLTHFVRKKNLRLIHGKDAEMLSVGQTVHAGNRPGNVLATVGRPDAKEGL
jgi:hypothetical protein